MTKKGFTGEIILVKGYYDLDGKVVKIGNTNITDWGYAIVVDGVATMTSEKEMKKSYNDYLRKGWKVKDPNVKKAAAPAAPAASQKTEKEKKEKMAENAEKRDEAEGYKKPQTRSEALEKKYGDKEQRRAFAIRRSEVREECYKLLCEEVKKSGKRLPRKVFCDRLDKMVKERMA